MLRDQIKLKLSAPSSSNRSASAPLPIPTGVAVVREFKLRARYDRKIPSSLAL